MPSLNNYRTLKQKNLNNLQSLNMDEINIGNISIQDDNTITGVREIDFVDGVNTYNIGIDPNGDFLISGTKELRITTDGVNMEGETLNMTGGEIHNCPLIHSQNNQNLTIEAKGTGDVILKTNNVNRVVVDENGNVNVDSGVLYVDAQNNRIGINTITPSQSLDINGTQVVNGLLSSDTLSTTGIYQGLIGTGNYRLKFVNSTITSNDAPSIDFSSTSTAFRGRIEYRHDQNAFRWYTNGQARCWMDGFGQMSIGGSGNPFSTLDIQSGDIRIRTGKILLNNTYSTLGINTSDALLRVNPTTTNFGIGQAPSHKLDVAGNMNITTGNTYKINSVDVLSSTTLGSSIVNSSLTSVGTLNNLTINPAGTLTLSNITSTTDLRLKTNDGSTLFINNDKTSGNVRFNTGSLSSSVSIDNGDFFVGINKFYVDSSNSRVGINCYASYTLDVSGNCNIYSGNTYKINGTDVLSSTTLGSGIINSSLTSLGTLSSLNVSGNLVVDTNTLFVDSTNNRVGIGISTPERGLHYRGDSFRMDRDGNTSGFQIHRWASGYTSVWKGFQLGVDASGSNNGEFFIGDYGTNLSGSSTRRLTISNDGSLSVDTNVLYVDATNNRIGINTSSPSENLTLIGNQLIAPNTSTSVGTPFIRIRNTGTGDGSPNSMVMGIDGSLYSGIAYIDTTKAGVANDTPLSFRLNSIERMRMNSSGNIYMTQSLGVNTNTTDSNFVLYNNGYIRTKQICCRVKKDLAGASIAPNTSMFNSSPSVDTDSLPSGLSAYGFKTSGTYNGMYRFPVNGQYQVNITWRMTDGSGGTRGMMPKLFDGTNYTNCIDLSDGVFWTPEDGATRRVGQWSDLLYGPQGYGIFPTTHSSTAVSYCFMSVILVQHD